MDAYQKVVAFDRGLKEGDRVAARWTWNFGNYCDTGIVVKLNRKSVRVRIDNGVSYGRDGSLPAGHVVSVPRTSNLDSWSWNNGVFPAECGT